jgi:hypothetical protein
MKSSLSAAALMIAVIASPSWIAPTTAQESRDAHHPAPAATPGPDAAQMPQPGQPGPAGMGMMNMMEMMRMMRMTEMMGPGMAGMAMVDHVEGRIAFLRAELKITEAQASAWNVFADALRANAHKLAEVRGSMMPHAGSGQQQAPTMVERLELQERWLVARLEGTRAIRSAVTNLYAALSDDQKKTADELLAPHMGMGMMAMMSRQMQPGGMQPSGPAMMGQMPGMGPGMMMNRQMNQGQTPGRDQPAPSKP